MEIYINSSLKMSSEYFDPLNSPFELIQKGIATYNGDGTQYDCYVAKGKTNFERETYFMWMRQKKEGIWCVGWGHFAATIEDAIKYAVAHNHTFTTQLAEDDHGNTY